MCASSSYPVNDPGGSDTISLSIANFPSHSHNNSQGIITTDLGGYHRHRVYDYTTDTDTGSAQNYIWGRANTNGSTSSKLNTDSGGSHSHTLNPSTDSAGMGNPFNIIPPCHHLIYIIKLS